MKISNKWHNFLFGWRRGTAAYLLIWLGSFGGLGQLLNGADSYLGVISAYCFVYFIFQGYKKCGFIDLWDKEEYTNLK
jgi:hypothetical protein